MGIPNSSCQTETEAKAKTSVLEGRARAAMCCSSFLPSFQECQWVRGGSSMASQQTFRDWALCLEGLSKCSQQSPYR